MQDHIKALADNAALPLISIGDNELATTHILENGQTCYTMEVDAFTTTGFWSARRHFFFSVPPERCCHDGLLVARASLQAEIASGGLDPRYIYALRLRDPYWETPSLVNMDGALQIAFEDRERAAEDEMYARH